ncbi:hypothetical protein [Streptomyces sp. NPDC056061]|uniref:hypothetical protein n=1 Tax=Streptomyces sp. NPDC056061 TaxID=3345700 RepID=UPI0035D6FF57
MTPFPVDLILPVAVLGATAAAAVHACAERRRRATTRTTPGGIVRDPDEQPGHERLGHDQPGHERSGHNQPGHERSCGESSRREGVRRPPRHPRDGR